MSAAKFVVEFDYRSDDGPRLVGPFTSRVQAEHWVSAQHLALAEWSVVKLWIPMIEGASPGTWRRSPAAGAT